MRSVSGTQHEGPRRRKWLFDETKVCGELSVKVQLNVKLKFPKAGAGRRAEVTGGGDGQLTGQCPRTSRDSDPRLEKLRPTTR